MIVIRSITPGSDGGQGTVDTLNSTAIAFKPRLLHTLKAGLYVFWRASLFGGHCLYLRRHKLSYGGI